MAQHNQTERLRRRRLLEAEQNYLRARLRVLRQPGTLVYLNGYRLLTEQLHACESQLRRLSGGAP